MADTSKDSVDINTVNIKKTSVQTIKMESNTKASDVDLTHTNIINNSSREVSKPAKIEGIQMKPNDTISINNSNVNNNNKSRKDFFNIDIIKKGKKHKVTWADNIKKGSLYQVEKIESYKNYNLGIQNNQNSFSNKEEKEEKEESVKCKCIVF